LAAGSKKWTHTCGVPEKSKKSLRSPRMSARGLSSLHRLGTSDAASVAGNGACLAQPRNVARRRTASLSTGSPPPTFACVAVTRPGPPPPPPLSSPGAPRAGAGGVRGGRCAPARLAPSPPFRSSRAPTPRLRSGTPRCPSWVHTSASPRKGPSGPPHRAPHPALRVQAADSHSLGHRRPGRSGPGARCAPTGPCLRALACSPPALRRRKGWVRMVHARQSLRCDAPGGPLVADQNPRSARTEGPCRVRHRRPGGFFNTQPSVRGPMPGGDRIETENRLRAWAPSPSPSLHSLLEPACRVRRRTHPAPPPTPFRRSWVNGGGSTARLRVYCP
jgi:hypothetical protein